MEMAAPDRGTHKKSYQWILFYPRMNLVSTCHNYSPKHAWTLGKETIAAVAENDQSFINTRLEKLAFPHKQDNVKSLKFVSAVFIEHNDSNFYL
jgi:glycerol-3-phosphate cytidylyltransferase-like family protein